MQESTQNDKVHHFCWMPSSLLFGINNEGRVHTLSTSSTIWRELPYAGQEFKKLSAVPHFLWAVGGDHQIYVYVHGLDFPIKIREESYENERWIPIEGFSSRLLPTDRYHFSNEGGTMDKSIDKIRLPSMAWQWEGEWKLDLSLDGQPLDHDGWSYAVDFPSHYSPTKQWSSYVRRRLWIRSRRYSAMNSWCAIAPLHKDATAEPFIDISIGGQDVVGAEPGTMLVWAVTSHNRVMFRSGVTTKSPEGAKWLHITTPQSCEVCQVTVGITGLVWAALLDGRALVRAGVTRVNLSGESWIEIRNPIGGVRIAHVSVGKDAVWAVGYDKQVWFRKGVKGESAGTNEEHAAGCGWVEMVGRMSMISVAANDQVWGIGASDRLIYFRSGVTSTDLTGKQWRVLRAPLQVSRASSNASLSREKLNQSLISLNNRPHSIAETASAISNWEEQSHSAPTAPLSLPVGELTGKHFETPLKNPRAWSPVRSVGSVVGTEAHPESDQSVWQADNASNSSFFFPDDEGLCWAECEAAWTWIEAGACYVDPVQLPNWFVEMGSIQQADLDKPWRLKILEELKKRLPSDEKFVEYEKCNDICSWVHTGEAKVNLLHNEEFLDCVIQLEWMLNSGTVTILNPGGATTMHQFSINDVTCIQNCAEPGNPRLFVHTPRISPEFIKLQFLNDSTLEEWQCHFATACKQIKNITGPAHSQSLWAVSKLGDIFVTDTKDLEENMLQKNKYVIEVDLGAKEEPIYHLIDSGLCPGSEIEIFGITLDNAERFAINLHAHTTYKLKHKSFIDFQNCCFHFNPRFSEGVVIRNSMIKSKWNEEERIGGIPFEKGQEFHVKILVREDDYCVYVNEKKFCTFNHRLPPYVVCKLQLCGEMQPFKLKITSPLPLISPLDFYWKQISGHLKKVESCDGGLTWGIGFDLTAWVYTKGWGGGFYGSIDSHNIHPMADSQDYKVYENQRWNPLTGYTSTGLPTDRHMWSDVTGKKKRIRDQVRLFSMHWQWISDWMVDFNVPGGVDRDGWQYAVDFPSTYHANKQFTDLVRRRRWYRKCAIVTTGPWQELGNTKLLDLTLKAIDDDPKGPVALWALATGGQAMFRIGVTKENQAGNMWEHVNSPQPLQSISCGPFKQVWATGKNGCAYWRVGVTSAKLDGNSWALVDPPCGTQLQQVSCGEAGVWAIDTQGQLYIRKDVTEVFPEGTQWRSISLDPSVFGNAQNKLTDAELNGTKFKCVSVGKREVWVTLTSGALLRRHGVHPSSPSGFGWDTAITSNWQYVSAKGFN